jgi:hypothetical protein
MGKRTRPKRGACCPLPYRSYRYRLPSKAVVRQSRLGRSDRDRVSERMADPLRGSRADSSASRQPSTHSASGVRAGLVPRSWHSARSKTLQPTGAVPALRTSSQTTQWSGLAPKLTPAQARAAWAGHRARDARPAAAVPPAPSPRTAPSAHPKRGAFSFDFRPHEADRGTAHDARPLRGASTYGAPEQSISHGQSISYDPRMLGERRGLLGRDGAMHEPISTSMYSAGGTAANAYTPLGLSTPSTYE